MLRKINRKNNIFLFSIFILFFLFCFSKNALAADIRLNPANGLYKVGDTIQLNVSISSNVLVNATAVKIYYPADLLTLTSISKQNTIVSLWAQEPLYSNVAGEASFEGVILYGYSGDKGNIATLNFKAKAIGTASVTFGTSSILAHDGNGTNVLANKYGSTLTIIKGSDVLEKDSSGQTGDFSILVKEIESSDYYSQNKFVITAAQKVKDNLYSIKIDDTGPIMWVDDGSHVFVTPMLKEGNHTLKVLAVDNKNLNNLNGYLNFNTKLLKTPSITFYEKELKVGDLVVIKGVADPNISISFVGQNNITKESFEGYTQTNLDGHFTFVLEKNLEQGTYSFISRAHSKNGVSSDYSEPITIIYKYGFFKTMINFVIKLIKLILPYLIIIIIFLLLILYAIYRIKKYQILLKKKLNEAEEIVDIELGKINKTDPGIGADIKSAEEVINQEMKDLEVDIDKL